MGVALVCSECKTTETSRWYGNGDDKDKPVCAVCYNRQLAASHGKCSKCGTDGRNTSALIRSKLKENAWYCQPCSRQEFHFFAGAGHPTRRGDDVRDVWDGYGPYVAELQRRARN
eukprot:CAMPEP_0119208240 /NCGR_PEP_ID=MMETSP1327-20130426/494_1 /TAXON_ID=38833 /ORGANISM="Micromonas pusilla, Strain RCC2306" /LENGTH=114 /DNA_ID=CAMNT_0007204709 /DNA_START=101 /DNA_END=445 /DNA_ORIENTATION=-